MVTRSPVKWIECVVCGKTCPKRGRLGVTCLSGACSTTRELMRQKAKRAGMSVETLAMIRKARTVKHYMRRSKNA